MPEQKINSEFIKTTTSNQKKTRRVEKPFKVFGFPAAAVDISFVVLCCGVVKSCVSETQPIRLLVFFFLLLFKTAKGFVPVQNFHPVCSFWPTFSSLRSQNRAAHSSAPPPAISSSKVKVRHRPRSCQLLLTDSNAVGSSATKAL